jgi:hypothetical protein
MRHVYSFVFLAMMVSGFYIVAHSPDGSPPSVAGAVVGVYGLILFLFA